MAEPETQTEEDTGEFVGEFTGDVTTDATDTDLRPVDTPIESHDTVKYESTDYDYESIESNADEDLASSIDEKKAARREELKKMRKKRRKSLRERCADKKWTCDGGSLWRIYVKSYLESREEKSKEEKGVLKQRISPDVPRLPRAEAIEEIFPPYECFPLGFQREREVGTAGVQFVDRCDRTRIWKSMRTRRPTADTSGRRERLSRGRSWKWPNVWPCTTRDLAGELKAREKLGKKKKRDVFPCESPDEDKDELLLRERMNDLANRKELGHVRAPVTCAEPKTNPLVDRAAGEHPGLVDGDYVITEIACKGRDKRIYANVVLRGLKGMHLPELSSLRERRSTWKFCFYQAIVALLARTQLRYKYAWGANIDYIYDHAWTLYTHVGAINVKAKQRFDDIVVYNYKYSVEVELIRETNDVPIARGVDWNYEEKGLRRQITLRRKDPLRVRVELGCEKITNPEYVPVHESTRGIEEWFDGLAVRHRNCIFRTARFSLAFWQDGLFWYLYNPYRCNEFGLWDDDGSACIVKFCSRDSLRRHLMILLLRTYAYDANSRSIDAADRSRSEKDDVYDVRIFNVALRCCQLHNPKLLQREPKLPRCVDECPSDISCADDSGIRGEGGEEEREEDDPQNSRERITWLKRFRVTWSKCAPAGRKRRSVKIAGGGDKPRWHHYYVEEPNKLFSLWGEIHITDDMFDEANRGMQTYACYAVCAGMTRITAPEYWTPKILDVIVMCGDRYYARSKLEAESKSATSEYARVSCWAKYLSDSFKIGETVCEIRMLPSVCGKLYAKSDGSNLWQSLERTFAEHHFVVLTCENVCLGLFKFCGAYYACDVNSFGPPLFQYGRGASYLLRATSFYKFLTVLVSTIDSPECSRFTLNPIEILKIVEVGPALDFRARTIGEGRKRFGKFAARGKRGVLSTSGRKDGRESENVRSMRIARRR